MSRSDPEVHVVVVQSQENGKMGSKMLRRTFASMSKEGSRGEYMQPLAFLHSAV